MAAFAYLQCGDVSITRNPSLPTTVYNVSVPVPTTGAVSMSMGTTKQMEVPSAGVQLVVALWTLALLLVLH